MSPCCRLPQKKSERDLFAPGQRSSTGYDAGVMDLRMSGGPFFEDFSDDKFLRGEDAPVNKEFAAFEVIVFYQCGNNALDGSNAGSGSEEDGFTAPSVSGKCWCPPVLSGASYRRRGSCRRIRN